MDIEIQNRRHEALFKNGKYQYTFTPNTPNEVIKIHHMGCVGDTRLNHIQLEQGTEVTSFVAPDKKVNSLSGIFKQLRDLDIQMRDPKSDLWGKIKLNNTGAILDFYNENIKTQLTTLAGKVNLAISELDNKVLKKSDVSIASNGITLGSGKTIDGRTIASIMKVQPDSIDLISPLIRVTGNMVLDGTLEGRKIKANTLETGHHKAGSITTEILAANAVKADNILVDNGLIKKFLANSAFITELFAKKAFINQLQTVKVTASQIDTDWLSAYTGDIGGFRIGKNPNDKDNWWLTGQNQFWVGMSNGGGNWGQTALWVNWGTTWGSHGDKAWFVKESGEMYCYNKARFWNDPEIQGDLYVSGDIMYKYGQNNFGHWIHSPNYRKIDHSGGYLYLYYASGAYNWIPMNQEISDRRFKHNIQPSKINALETINNIKTYSYTKKHNDDVEDIECGIMAQDVKEHAKNAFQKAPDDVYTYNTFKLVPYMIKAIQELSEENKKIKKEMEKLKYAA